MRLAFDLDNTLIRCGHDFPLEKPRHRLLVKLIGHEQRHDREVQARCTKHSPSFGIDLLIDDSEGVRIEGERHGFRVLVVAPEDAQWAQKVRAALDAEMRPQNRR